eukprot:Skav209617  [mRNA]  locus=scaffold902:6224:13897:+ [translate_table: standard]
MPSTGIRISCLWMPGPTTFRAKPSSKDACCEALRKSQEEVARFLEQKQKLPRKYSRERSRRRSRERSQARSRSPPRRKSDSPSRFRSEEAERLEARLLLVENGCLRWWFEEALREEEESEAAAAAAAGAVSSFEPEEPGGWVSSASGKSGPEVVTEEATQEYEAAKRQAAQEKKKRSYLVWSLMGFWAHVLVTSLLIQRVQRVLLGGKERGFDIVLSVTRKRPAGDVSLRSPAKLQNRCDSVNSGRHDEERWLVGEEVILLSVEPKAYCFAMNQCIPLTTLFDRNIQNFLFLSIGVFRLMCLIEQVRFLSDSMVAGQKHFSGCVKLSTCKVWQEKMNGQGSSAEREAGKWTIPQLKTRWQKILERLRAAQAAPPNHFAVAVPAAAPAAPAASGPAGPPPPTPDQRLEQLKAGEGRRGW